MKNLIVILVVILSPIVAKADTMTLVDNSSVNGAVRYLEGTFQLTGRFKVDGKYVTKTYQISREKVSSVRINNNVNNPGPPPPGINKYEVGDDLLLKFPSSAETKAAEPPPSRIVGVTSANPNAGVDRVKLTDKTEKKGTLTLISEDQVALNNEEPIDREKVVYITVGLQKSTAP